VVPPIIQCPCGHRLLSGAYRMLWPEADTPRFRIIEGWNPAVPSYSYLCPNCAHYLVNRPPG
jgi:hypothetical protein